MSAVDDAAISELYKTVSRTTRPVEAEIEHDAVQVVTMSDVEEKSVKWLWPGYLPAGAIAMMDGDPGIGKSTTYIDIIARLTTGRPMPDGTNGDVVSGDVVLITNEDDTAATIRPRLRVAKADLSRVHQMKHVTEPRQQHPRQLFLPQDLGYIERICRQTKARLLVIDPLMAHLGGSTDSYRDQDVRAALTPLAILAEELNMGVLLVRHLTKQQARSASHAGSGSIGISGQARVVWMVARDPEDDTRGVLSIGKCNIAVRADSLSYELAPVEGEQVTRVVWHGSSPYSAEELYSKTSDGGRKNKLAQARDFIRDVLIDGPHLSDHVKDMTMAIGVSERTYKRAFAGVAEAEKGKGLHAPWACRMKGTKPISKEDWKRLEEQHAVRTPRTNTVPF